MSYNAAAGAAVGAGVSAAIMSQNREVSERDVMMMRCANEKTAVEAKACMRVVKQEYDTGGYIIAATGILLGFTLLMAYIMKKTVL